MKDKLETRLTNADAYRKQKEYLLKRKVEITANLSKLKIIRNQIIMAEPEKMLDIINKIEIPEFSKTTITKDAIELELLEMEKRMKELRKKLMEVKE